MLKFQVNSYEKLFFPGLGFLRVLPAATSGEEDLSRLIHLNMIRNYNG